MFLSKLDQGAIINGIRCDKYPDNKCDGIIITASCDIANEKVSKLYYIVGVEVDEWFISEHGFYLAYNKSIEKKTDDYLEKYGLDAKTILDFNRTEAEKVIKEFVDNKNDKATLISHLTTFFNYKEANKEERKKIIKESPKLAYDLLKQINKGSNEHYYFLPKAGYIESDKNKILDEGIIIDLQEIGIISFQDAKLISDEGIDYSHLTSFSPDDRERFKKQFWLNSKDDFVIIESTICSPWREHLMQRFSHSFIRIGLDGATDNDLKKFKERLAGK